MPIHTACSAVYGSFAFQLFGASLCCSITSHVKSGQEVCRVLLHTHGQGCKPMGVGAAWYRFPLNDHEEW